MEQDDVAARNEQKTNIQKPKPTNAQLNALPQLVKTGNTWEHAPPSFAQENAIWDEYWKIKVTNNSQIPRKGVCKWCHYVVSRNGPAQVNHIRRMCPNPPKHKDQYEGKGNDRNEPDDDEPPRKKRRISNGNDNSEPFNLETAKKLLSTWLFRCAIPWNTIKHDDFKAFVKYLNPLFTPPTPKTISNKYLNEAYEECKAKVAHVKTFVLNFATQVVQSLFFVFLFVLFRVQIFTAFAALFHAIFGQS